ncbi:hypothetical protein [Aestuariibaculum sediminum]|uniref:Thioredoxin domain-containing protein n=1 Tax=Aestuariibaculum sediminum TaxID=2770637 RepID=A0A8J6Q3I8_9FLAO|nr:hypothetical protein [Aestuariibaculum sediminum]MBD0833726.1 hypothetical protein [Aestuariibaculum sediminum]
MKKTLILFLILSILFSLYLLIQKGRLTLGYNDLRIVVNKQQDSLNKALMQSDYFNSLAMKNYQLGNLKIKKLDLYKFNDTGLKIKTKLPEGDKKKFIIRYSDIGCNTCVNLIFKRPERIKRIQEKFDIIVLVDFNRYEDFVLWKRASEIGNNVFWVKKGELPFDSLFEPSSYSFILDEKLEVHSFFVPNNVFPDEVHNYLNILLNNNDKFQE